MASDVKFIAVDPGSCSVGVAYRADGALITRVIAVDRTLQRERRFARILDQLRDVLGKAERSVGRSAAVVYYRPFARGADATRCLWGVAGIVEALAAAALLPVMDVTDATVRSHFEIKAPKDTAPRKRNFLKEAAKNILIQKGIDVAGRTEDEIDAALLLLWTEENHACRRSGRKVVVRRSRAA